MPLHARAIGLQTRERMISLPGGVTAGSRIAFLSRVRVASEPMCPKAGPAAALAALLPFAASCGGGSDGLELFFQDELVEAPARNVEILALRGKSCEEVLSVSHESLRSDPGLLLRAFEPYPVNPEHELLADLPSSEAVTLAIAAYDSELLQVARACRTVTLDGSQDEPLRIELRALPDCAAPPSKLDVMLVLDTSFQMEFADPDRAHIPELLDSVLDPATVFPETTWGVVTFGHNDRAAELLPPTSDLQEVRRTISALEGVHQGQPRLYDALHKATALLRARAVCGRAPALVVVASAFDSGSERFFEDAQIGVFATAGDSSDDLFLFGIALSTESYEVLDRLIPEGELGVVTGAGSRAQIDVVMREARDALAALIGR